MDIQLVDIKGTLLVVAAATALAGSGIALDRLLLLRQKTLLANWATRWWDYIDDLPIRDVSRDLISVFLGTVYWARGPNWVSKRFIVTSLIFSITLTSVAIVIGEYIYLKDWNQAVFERFLVWRTLILFAVNYVLDMSTILLTVLILRIALSAHWIFRLSLLILDVVLAICLSFLCYGIADAMFSPVSPGMFSGTWEGFGSNLATYLKHFDYLGIIDWSVIDWTFGDILVLNWTHEGFHSGNLETFLYSSTTLIPSAGYALLLIAILFSLAALHIARFLPLQLLALSVETDKSVFYCTGTLFGLVAIVGKLLIEVVKSYG